MSLKVLVACEFSGVVRRAFAAQGHYVTSVDLLPAEDGANYQQTGKIGFHWVGDIRHFLSWRGHGYFDLMIAHPPCTFLALSGNRWRKGQEEQVKSALDFGEALWQADIPRIAIEQPRSTLARRIGKHTQDIHPYDFGVPEFKTTWLWLKGLPPLMKTLFVVPPDRGTTEHRKWSRVHRAAPGKDRWKERSRTLPEIAAAMANQWGFPPAKDSQHG